MRLPSCGFDTKIILFFFGAIGCFLFGSVFSSLVFSSPITVSPIFLSASISSATDDCPPKLVFSPSPNSKASSWSFPALIADDIAMPATPTKPTPANTFVKSFPIAIRSNLPLYMTAKTSVYPAVIILCRFTAINNILSKKENPSF